MSRENVEIVRDVIAAFNSRGLSSALELFDPDAVFEEPPEQPGAEIARGRDQVQRIFGRFDETWAEHRSDPTEIRSLDDRRVLVLSVERFRGRDGIDLEQAAGTVFTLVDRKVVRMQAFWSQVDRDEIGAELNGRPRGRRLRPASLNALPPAGNVAVGEASGGLMFRQSSSKSS